MALTFDRSRDSPEGQCAGWTRANRAHRHPLEARRRNLARYYVSRFATCSRLSAAYPGYGTGEIRALRQRPCLYRSAATNPVRQRRPRVSRIKPAVRATRQHQDQSTEAELRRLESRPHTNHGKFSTSNGAKVSTAKRKYIASHWYVTIRGRRLRRT